MTASFNLIAGTFQGAVVEPGTFHLCGFDPMSLRTDPALASAKSEGPGDVNLHEPVFPDPAGSGVRQPRRSNDGDADIGQVQPGCLID